MAQSSLLRLERIKDRFGAPFAARKLAALKELARTRMRTAREVERLHEAVCFVRAYPDDRRVLAAARRLLATFGQRADLRRARSDLDHSGITGTTCWFPFFYPTAVWLAEQWPEQLRFDRGDIEADKNLAQWLPLLLTPLEAEAVRGGNVSGYSAVDRVRARDQTDATFLVRRVLALPGSDAMREAFYDAINPSCELLPAADTPSRTRAELARAPLVFQSGELRRGRPDVRASIARAPRGVDVLGGRQARTVIDLARGAMVTRKRDLDAFAYGDEREALLVDDGSGLAFAFNGVRPARRAPIAALFGGLTLQNGVPIGYIQADCVGGSVALSFNTFETFRGGESAHTFARLLAVLHHVFGAASFSIEPYQLGAGNEEGLASGAWWFYFKLGFRPRDRATLRLAVAELERMRRKPGYRSDRATLARLAQHHLFFAVESHATPFLPPLVQIGWQCARELAEAAGAERERAVAALGHAALARTGQRSLRGFSPDEKRAWSQWAPIAAQLPLERWRATERAALVDLIRAKGAPSERSYVARFAAHERLQRDLWKIAGQR
ncbi:MAG TPA: hypothetical protein VLW55_10695 [Burkholderiaceae bacterium]|nr:hypothetical protein [Burkholderiaceae bacterium]